MTRAWHDSETGNYTCWRRVRKRACREFDEEVKRAIVDNLEHFTEKETQMLGVQFWPPNIDMNNNNNTGHRQGKVREGVRRVANPWRKRKMRRSAQRVVNIKRR